jgi:hypothetical protein
MVLQGESAAVVQEHREALDRLAAQLGDALYGPDGMPWGTKFSDLESKAFEIGLAVARRIVQQRVAEQAQQPLPEELTRCPHCSGPLEMADQEPRHVLTRSGGGGVVRTSTHLPAMPQGFFSLSPRVWGST